MLEVNTVNDSLKTIKYLDKETTLVKDDVHGFWTFTWSTGEPPVKLQSQYTTPAVAIENYVNYVDSLKKKTTKE